MATKTRTHFNKATQKSYTYTQSANYLDFVKSYETEVLKGELKLNDEEVKEWIANNPERFAKRINSYKDSIALMRFNDIHNVVSNAINSTYLMNAAEKKPANKITTPDNIIETYSRISTDFYQYIRNIAKDGLDINQTGTPLIQQTVNLNKAMLYQYTRKGVSIPYSQLVAANQNILDKGKFLVYDIETMGGIDNTGQQILDTVTEFSFGIADSKTGEIGDYYGSVIGQDKNMHKKFSDLIKKYETGEELSNRDIVILKRLAKTGHKNTGYREIAEYPGLFEFTSFASDNDIKTMNPKDMRRGADLYLDIYNKQQKNKVTYQGKEMLAWEQRFIEALNIRKNQDLTALGHNSGSFDIEMLKRFTQSNMFSDNAKTVMNDMGLDFNWQNRHMDTLAALRSTRGNNWLDMFTPESRKFMKENGLTHFTLEALTHNYDPEFYNKQVAHVSRTDIAANASMYAKSGLFDTTNKDYIFKKTPSKPRALIGDGKMLFYAPESMGVDNDRSGMMSFVDDAFTGDIRTFGGYNISNDGKVHKELFGQYGFQRGVSYTLDSIYEHEMTDEWSNAINETHPGMNSTRIVTAVFKPQADDKSFKASSTVTLVGTRQDVEQRINQHLILTGHKKKGRWRITEEAKELLSVTEIDLDGKETNLGFTIEEQLEESKFHFQNEAASRARRSLEINKEKGLLSFLNDMESYVNANAGENAPEDVKEAFRKRFHETVRTQSIDIERGETVPRINLPGIGTVKTYQEYFGWQDSNTGNWRVYRETIDAALNSESYANSIRDIMSVVIEAAEKRGGNDKRLQDFYFKQYFTGLQAYMAQNSTNGIDTVTNTEPLKIRAIDRHKFEVNLEGYAYSPGTKTPSVYNDNSNILSINLNTSNISLAERLMEKRGFAGVADESERAKEIYRFINYLNKRSVINNDRVVSAEDLETHTAETLTQHLLESLREIRSKNEGVHGESFGRILIGKRQNVTIPSEMAKMGFTKQAVENILEEIDKTLPKTKILDKNNIDVEAENVVKNLLFDKVSKEDLINLGYSEEHVDDLMDMRAIRMKDTIKFMKDFMSGIHKTGAEILYDEDTKEINLMVDGLQTRLSNLPRDVFQDGRFYTQVGNMKVSSPVGLYASEWDKNLKFQSLIGKAHDSVYWMATAFERGIKEGDLGGQINRVVSSFAKILRESSSVMKGDAQDSRSDFAFSMGDVIAHVQRLNKEGVFKNTEFNKPEEMKKLLTDKKFNPDYLNYWARSLITINARLILQAIAEDSGDGMLKKMVKKFSWDNKEIADFVGTLFNKPHFGDVYGSSKRGIHQQVSRALRFNADDAKVNIARNALKDISIGRSLHTATELAEAKAKLDGLNYETESAIRVNRLSMSTKDVRKLVNSANIENRYIKEMLTNIHLEDGAAVADPRILDNIFNERPAIQKIALYRISEHNINTINALKTRRDLVPKLRISKDGKITFEYRNGLFVSQGEEIIDIGGYKDTTREIYAKEAGMFRFGVFSKTGGLLADPKSIIGTLEQHKPEIMDAVDREQAAYNVLNKYYDIAYYVKPFDANPHRKIAEGSIEKNMTRFLAGGFGTSEDSRVAQTLKALGLNDFLFQVPDKEYIESLGAEDIQHTALGAMIKKVNRRNIKHKEIVDIINENFGDVTDFQKALMSERYKPMEELKTIISNSGLIRSGETFHMLSNNFEEELKHQDPVGAIKRIVDNLLYKYGNDVDKVKNVLKDAIPGLEVKNGYLVAPNKNIHLDKLEDIIKRENLSTARNVNGIAADLSQTELTAMDFSDRSAMLAANASHGEKQVSKGLKITNRNLQMLEWERYDEESLSRVKAALNPEIFNKYFGHVLDENGAIKKGYKRPIAQSIGNQFRQLMFARPGEKMLMENGEIDEEERVKLVEKLGKKGSESIDSILKSVQAQGISTVSSNAIEDRYSFISGILARSWNTGNSGYKLEDMVDKAGFEVKTLKQIITSSGENGDIPDAIYGKKLMIDLHMDELGDNQLYIKPDERYLALPYTTKEYIDPDKKEDARNIFQKKVAQLKRKQVDYTAAVSTEEKNKIFQEMSNIIVGAKKAISNSVDVKKQSLARLGEVRLFDSGRFTASGFELFGDETSEYHRDLKFDGINLAQEAAKDSKVRAEYDVTLVGRNFINKIYNEKYLSELGLSQEEIVEYLKTEGTLSLNVREPADYKKSVSVSSLYLSDAVTGNTALSSAIQFKSKKGDYDGDNISIAILKGKAIVKGEVRNIDYASFQVLKKKGEDIKLTEETEQLFNDAKASVHYYAADYNKRYQDAEKEVVRNSLDLTKARSYAIDDVLRAQNESLNTKQESELTTIYNNIVTGMEETYGDKLADNIDDMRIQGVKYVESLGIQKAEDREQHFKALHYGISRWREQVDNVAKSRKAAAGEANNYLYWLRRIVDIASNSEENVFTQDERSAIQKVTLAIQEGFLTPKGESTIDIGILEEFKGSFSEMMGQHGKTDGSRMYDFLINRLKIAERKEMKSLPSEDWDAQRAAKVFSNIGERIQINPGANDYFLQSISIKGLDYNKRLIRVGENIDSVDTELTMAHEVIAGMGMDSNIAQKQLMEVQPPFDTDITSANAKVARTQKALDDSEQLLNKIRHQMKKTGFTAKNLALGAMGLAGTVMMAGFVGGNPSRPAQTHAQEKHIETYQIPQLPESNLNNIRGGPRQGYVININAQTNQGQQYASNAIQQALASGFNNTNINVAMNIHNSAEADTAQVIRMLETAFQ